MPSKGDIVITRVPFQMISPLWDQISFHLRRGCEVGGILLPRQLERFANSLDDLWLIIEHKTVVGAFATTIFEEDGKRLVGVSNLSGSSPMRWAAKMCDLMAEYARANDCDFVRCYGRQAWARLLPHVLITGRHDNGHMIFERAA